MPNEVLEELALAATPRNINLYQLITNALHTYLNPQDTNDEKILASIRAGLQDVLAGRTKLASESLAELERELEAESHKRKMLLKGETKELSLLISSEELEELKTIAQEQAVEISELVLIALELYLDEE